VNRNADALSPDPGTATVLVDRLRALGRPDLFRHFVDLFLKNAPTSLREARRAEREGDWSGVGKAAQVLRSSSAWLGLSEMTRLARGLEEASCRRESGRVLSLLGEAEDFFAGLRARLVGDHEGMQPIRRESHA
jgi:HPt (histidine-containing phosphotransfer) domain-containing protein